MTKDKKAEIYFRLEAPIIVLQKAAKGRYLFDSFAKAGVQELQKIQRLIGKKKDFKKEYEEKRSSINRKVRTSHH